MSERLGNTSIFLPMRIGPATPSSLVEFVQSFLKRPNLEITRDGLALANRYYDDFFISWHDIKAIKYDLNLVIKLKNPKKVPVSLVAMDGSERALPANLEIVGMGLSPILEVCLQQMTGRGS